MPSSSKSFLKTSFKPLTSSLKRVGTNKQDNTFILVVLGVLLFGIIVGTISYSSFKNSERFTNQTNKLVYLYMNSCGFCKEFNTIWEEISKEIKKEPVKYKINMEKYDLNDGGIGTKLSNENKIDYAPAIILITPNKNYLYEGERTKEAIFKWISTKV